jgi:hypothetical protein
VHLLQTFGELKPLRTQPSIAGALALPGCVAILLPIYMKIVAMLTYPAEAHDLRSSECLFCIYFAALADRSPFFRIRNGLALAV